MYFANNYSSLLLAFNIYANETQHFRMASVELEATSNAKNLKTRFNTASEVTSFLTRFMGCIQRSRSALVNPKKRTLEELRNSKNVVCFTNLYKEFKS